MTMLSTSLKFAAPPLRKGLAPGPTGATGTVDLRSARASESDIKLGTVLAAAASLALTLAPQASQAAEAVVEQALQPGGQSMAFQQMQTMVNQARVGPGFDSHMKGHIPKGSLLIGDAFTPMGPGQEAHGVLVKKAAHEQGFRGPTFANQSGTSMDSRESIATLYELGTPELSQEEARHYIGRYASLSARGMVNDQIDNVYKAINSGAQNSVLNLSMGTSKARIAKTIYSEGAIAWMPDVAKDAQAADTVLANYATAFDLSFDKLKSADPKISGPERQKLQQGIVDLVSSNLDTGQEFAEAQSQWAEAVDIFETEGRNSVVISAGNQGDAIALFRMDNHGREIQVGPDFETSVLQTEAVTSVGATRWHHTKSGLQESVADYNSNAEGIDIYASGSLATKEAGKADTFGTSFSAPRVSATMAELHEQNPTFSSDQVEDLMKNQLSHQLKTESGQVTVLDYQLASNYLANHQ